MVAVHVVFLIAAAGPAAALNSRTDLMSSFELEGGSDLHAKANEGSSLDRSRVNTESGLMVEDSLTLSPAERAAMHSQKFETEFVADLDMTDAAETGRSVGVTFDMDTDFQPVSILKIKKNGILEEWNKAHPEKAVMVGDEVVQVNDIKWHANSQTFAERIKGQFLAAKRKTPGAKNTLSLYMQRPRREKVVRYQAQREDLHRKLYSTEFVADIPMKGVLPRDSMQQAMGWRLNSSVDWQPVSIDKLRTNGLVAKYNKEHPDAKIRAGDEIIQVNHIQWHHSAAAFEDRLGAQFVAAQKKESTRSPHDVNVLKLSVRRPRSANNDAPDDEVYTKHYTVHLNLRDSHTLGWHLNAGNDTDMITVDKIMNRKGHPIQMYNAANPTNAVQVGDKVLRVNNVTWHSNTKKFAERIEKEFEKVRPRKGGTPHAASLELHMMRRLVQPIAKEWTVTLQAEEGGVLGWQLNYSEEEFPLTVAKIRNSGAVFEFNQEHPDSRIIPGDVIVKANASAIDEALWREDSPSFEKRLNEVFSKAKKTGSISIFVRRPEGVRDTTNDLSADRPFFREFIVNLPCQNTLGWQLQSENDTSPLTVAKIRAVGAVHDWNERNPLNDIQVGDHIAKVNNIFWRNNTESFEAKLNLQLKLVRESTSVAKPVVQLLVQRPWRSYAAESIGSAEDSGGDVAGASEEEETGAVD